MEEDIAQTKTDETVRITALVVPLALAVGLAGHGHGSVVSTPAGIDRPKGACSFDFLGIFADGFEDGDTLRWSAWSP